MSDTLFSSSFDMEAYLKKRTLEIESLDDRRLYKAVAEKLIMELFSYQLQAEQNLEKRVFDEVKTNHSDFAVYLGLTERGHYDATDPFLFPILTDDLIPKDVPAQELLTALASGTEYPIYTVFLQAAYPVTQTFEQPGRKYNGVVKTARGEYRATFSVQKNTAYLDQIQRLYEVFLSNSKYWITLCDAYLHKMYTVRLCSVEQMPSTEEIGEVSVNFEEYTDAVRYHMIPLWNIEHIEEKTSTYPVPCKDQLYFEHRIYAHRLDADCRYLVTNVDTEVADIRRVHGDLIITCPVDTPYQWRLYKLNPKPQKMAYRYPILSNQSKESFADSLTQIYQKSVKTKAEIARLIESFDYNAYLHYEGMTLEKAHPVPEQAYDMDAFIADELRVGENGRETLMLSFTAVDQRNYLNYDVLSFLVTQVQKLFPEYHCSGRLI